MSIMCEDSSLWPNCDPTFHRWKCNYTNRVFEGCFPPSLFTVDIWVLPSCWLRELASAPSNTNCCCRLLAPDITSRVECIGTYLSYLNTYGKPLVYEVMLGIDATCTLRMTALPMTGRLHRHHAPEGMVWPHILLRQLCVFYPDPCTGAICRQCGVYCHHCIWMLFSFIWILCPHNLSAHWLASLEPAGVLARWMDKNSSKCRGCNRRGFESCAEGAGLGKVLLVPDTAKLCRDWFLLKIRMTLMWFICISQSGLSGLDSTCIYLS